MVPAEPAVVRTAREFKAALLESEQRQMREMARRWLGVEQQLEGNIEALAEQVARLAAKGETISQGKLYRLERYRRLLAQTQGEFAKYADYAEGLITERQLAFANAGYTQAQTLMSIGTVGGAFDVLAPAAVEAMVANIAGFAGDGVPLGDLLRRRMIQDVGAFDRLSRTLINGTALGWNPGKTAKRMKDDLADGLNKALVIARTEQIRAYRTAQLQTYAASKAVVGVQRLVTHDERTCIACLVDEGHIYPVDKGIPDHVQGRCAALPVIRGTNGYSFTRGEQWFRAQDAITQRGIMGAGRYELWQAGRIEWGDLATSTSNATWGAGIQPTPLRDLQ